MDELVQRDWDRCVEFHGHVCPGLAIGFQAAQIALKVLPALEGEPYNPKSGIVSIVQNDACGVDAVQTLLSSTFGKGNLMFKDHGKLVFSFIRRQDGRGVRVALKYDAMDNERHQALRPKVMDKTATPAEIEEFYQVHEELSRHLVEAPPEEHFDWREITFELPKGPKLNPTVQCAFCGEGVMEQRASVRDGCIACPECVETYESRVLVLGK
ncbi:FmdE family protein [Desulfosporosinus sp. OT]|uniref:FmdE family protein n=1 Tax=Desulfosporosinus sp. OT TaxID=913865 RepID=UPI000223B014|nr:FmdE family protein [Desulfosporosinus sp. OT]EGW40976.1 tungsten formylmethanofuran dehydrogenase, subunit E, FwdE family protein [Desulfosporosinus sp. OT]